MSEYYSDPHKYDDIIHLPHHRSRRRRPMPLLDRAAQFGAFEALSGHEEIIEETAQQKAESYEDEYGTKYERGEHEFYP